jgi:hypothetical protein
MNVSDGRIWKSAQCVMLCIVMVTASCTGDLRWTQKASVPVPDVGFETCIKAGIAEVSSVSITRFQYDRYMLDVKFQKPMPDVRAFVQKRDTPFADIVFLGKGWYESAEERSEVTPVLNELTDAIKRHCLTGKTAPSS